MAESLLVCQIGPYGFGAPIAQVTEILDRPTEVRVPRTPPLVSGVAVVRGQPLALWTLRPLLGLDPTAARFALRWEVGGEVVLVAVDGVDALWEPGPPLAREAWQGLLPPRILPLVSAGWRYGPGWVWAFEPDLPIRLRAEAETWGRARG
ncbi:MAG: chemotaxis protein CheW [Firmicutes bacterium]|nr:chemotaxis protein CheW [Alicyclobacillaceae bacterium]MCL6496313.1 chemotaxis protein CheW [Bacillota bacterium]